MVIVVGESLASCCGILALLSLSSLWIGVCHAAEQAQRVAATGNFSLARRVSQRACAAAPRDPLLWALHGSLLGPLLGALLAPACGPARSFILLRARRSPHVGAAALRTPWLWVLLGPLLDPLLAPLLDAVE